MHTRATLTHELKSLGVQMNETLMVHASLRKIGRVEGGADALLDALLDAVGPGGTILMVLGADADEPFDAQNSSAERDIGVLAEVFRRRNATRVNDHAAARFGACGSRAIELLEPAQLHDYYGPGSVLARFTDVGGTVLRLGADADTITLTHWAEYLAKVPGKRRVRRRYVRADSGEQWIESLDDTDGILDWDEGDYFSQIWLDFLQSGQVRVGSVGHCTAELFPAPSFVAFAVEWLETRF